MARSIEPDTASENDADRAVSPPPELTAFQQHCLRVIARDGPGSGQEIEVRLEGYYPDAVVNGCLYTNLDGLVEYGLVEKKPDWTDARTNVYGLTAMGMTTVRSITRRWVMATARGTATRRHLRRPS
jgi:PadR family transcriptional regulator PadR